jgi:protoporphyrinogen oxidase
VNDTEKGTQEWQETLDYGTIIEGIKSNSALNKVVIDIPADQQKAKVYVGKLGAAAPTGATYNKVSPIKTAVAKLDTEVTDAMKAAYHIVTVGGPCINKITAAAMGLTYPACGAASTIPENAAIIEVKDDVFTSGKVVVIVAGWEADNTRLACSVLQNYDAYKSQFGTAKKVKITGTIAAPSITPA